MGLLTAALVRKKINAAIQDMQEVEEIYHLHPGTCKYIWSRVWAKGGFQSYFHHLISSSKF